jgi:hypothetical protein
MKLKQSQKFWNNFLLKISQFVFLIPRQSVCACVNSGCFTYSKYSCFYSLFSITAANQDNSRTWNILPMMNGSMQRICKKKGKVVPVLNYLNTMLCRQKGEWRYSSTILVLGTRWRWVVSFTPLPLYLLYPLDRRLGEPQNRSRPCGEEKSTRIM